MVVKGFHRRPTTIFTLLLAWWLHLPQSKSFSLSPSHEGGPCSNLMSRMPMTLLETHWTTTCTCNNPNVIYTRCRLSCLYAQESHLWAQTNAHVLDFMDSAAFSHHRTFKISLIPVHVFISGFPNYLSMVYCDKIICYPSWKFISKFSYWFSIKDLSTLHYFVVSRSFTYTMY